MADFHNAPAVGTGNANLPFGETSHENNKLLLNASIINTALAEMGLINYRPRLGSKVCVVASP